MNLEISGQMRGPECHRVMQQAIVLRKQVKHWFELLPETDIAKVVIILRVDGSLGSFGLSGVENVERSGAEVSCDLVIGDAGWSDLSDAEIQSILLREVSVAIEACLASCEISFPRQEFESEHSGLGHQVSVETSRQ